MPPSITIDGEELTSARFPEVKSIYSEELLPSDLNTRTGSRPKTRITRVFNIEEGVRGYDYVAYIGDEDASDVRVSARVLIFRFNGLNKIEGAYVEIASGTSDDSDLDSLENAVDLDLDRVWEITTNLFDKYPHNFFIGHAVPLETVPVVNLPSKRASRTGRNPQTGATFTD